MKARILNKIIDLEGGYVDDPSDSGGETNFGITVATARLFGYAGPMRDLPRSAALEIYSRSYWDRVLADNMPEALAEKMVDAAVHLGVERASFFLQKSLNVLNKGGTLYPDIVVDCRIGRKTIGALEAYLKVRKEEALVKAIACLQWVFYMDLAGKREKDERFIYGWLCNRV